MKTKLFYVIYIQDEILRTLIDGIRYFADPAQKYQAHVTVRGPYEKRLRYEPTWKDALKGHQMEVVGLGTFFSENQSTVYLSCNDSPALRKVWNKKDYDEFHPHITLYNGTDQKYAHRLMDKLTGFDLRFKLKANRLEELTSPVQKHEYDLFEKPYLSSYINKKLLDELLEGEYPHSVEEISEDLRLHYIEKLAGLLSERSKSLVS